MVFGFLNIKFYCFLLVSFFTCLFQ